MIALSPRIDLASTRNMSEYASIVLGLMQVRVFNFGGSLCAQGVKITADGHVIIITPEL